MFTGTHIPKAQVPPLTFEDLRNGDAFSVAEDPPESEKIILMVFDRVTVGSGRSYNCVCLRTGRLDLIASDCRVVRRECKGFFPIKEEGKD